MNSRKILSFLAAAIFVFATIPAMAQEIQWLSSSGYIPDMNVESLVFETADAGSETDTTGSLVISANTSGEIVKPLELQDDYLLWKMHVCFAANNIPTGPVTLKIYQGSPDPLAALPSQVVFQQDIPIIPASLVECNEILVLDPADPTSIPIVPAEGPLFLGIGITDIDSPVYLKAVGIQEYSDDFAIDGCDTGVTDRLVTYDGQTTMLSTLITACEDGPPRNHGQYVKCVSHTLNDLKKSGEIRKNEKGRIQRCAAKANIP